MESLIIRTKHEERLGACYSFRVRALGIDYGQRRIGLALSDATGLLARPWKTVMREGTLAQTVAALAREVASLRAEDDGLAVVVVGWPRRLSGQANEQTRAVEAFVEHLRAAVALPVVLEDERLTSWEAEHVLAARERDWRKRKPLLDAMSAAVILQTYLDGRPRPSIKEDSPS
jgi:putative holliday junction resolvase